jgi:hypothetical protein
MSRARAAVAGDVSLRSIAYSVMGIIAVSEVVGLMAALHPSPVGAWTVTVSAVSLITVLRHCK